MSKYRRTIVTLDDTQTKKDYMLFCVFEKLWPDMVTPSPLHMHPKGKDFNNDGRFDICVHVDEVDITANEKAADKAPASQIEMCSIPAQNIDWALVAANIDAWCEKIMLEYMQ